MLFRKTKISWISIFVVLAAFAAWSDSLDEFPLYLDKTQPIDKRVDDLLSRMTLEEKLGQMNMPCVYEGGLGNEIKDKLEACKKFAEGTYRDDIGPGGGFFTLANTILPNGPRQQAVYFNNLQTIATEKTRLKIPLLQTEEGTHGLMCSGATIFPEGLALGSAWNPELIQQIYTIAAREARSVGIHQLFTLVIEPYRDPRMGRSQEGYSEDPYLVSCYAREIVKAIQGDAISAPDKAVAGFCHYPGQSQPVSGLERGAMEISERCLREVFLPSWFVGIREGGALGVMATYPAVDGVPAHASEKLLTQILRNEMHFDGLVLCEGGGIGTLIYEGLAADMKEAGQLALKAGVDVGISYEEGYMGPMAIGVREGKVPMQLIDRAVRRILKLKFRLGLFENPLVDPDRAQRVRHTQENQQIALQAAREGVVLLKNENRLLPLKKNIKSIAVIGPNADDDKNQLGDYTSISVLQDITTVLDGVKAKVSPQTKVTYVKGCNVIGGEVDEIDRARGVARSADVAIVVVGENEWRAEGKKGTSGEGYDVASLDLTGMQQELIEAVYETGTPTIVVLINGRPLSIRWVADKVSAVLEAWCSGEKGGEAIAEILFGETNPSGRLPVTVPRHVGQLPVYYNSKPSKSYWINEGWGKPYADMSAKPLYEFGYGLSYTTFEYGNLQISPRETGPSGTIQVSAEVTNTGTVAGQEVAQLYIHDVLSTVCTPVKQLKGFQKIALKPGETKTVQFELTPDSLALLNRNLEWVVEPGEFEIFIGHSSEDIRLKGKLQIKG